MAEILIKAVDATNPDATKDRVGCYKRGMPVVVMPDGHPWGTEETLPRFVVIKIPGVPVETIQKYIEPEYETGPQLDPPVYRRRKWSLRWTDLPQGVKDKFLTNGFVTIKAGAYAGAYDYTWQQVKAYFRNQLTGLDETEDF